MFWLHRKSAYRVGPKCKTVRQRIWKNKSKNFKKIWLLWDILLIRFFFLALSPSQIKAITYATTKELEEETNITNGNHVLNGIDPDDDSEENHNPNSSSSNATAGESRPGSYR